MAYILKGKKCGAVRFEPFEDIDGVVSKESVSMSSKITDNPIEDGSNINDHVFRNPEQYQLSGIVVGGQEAFALLTDMWKKGDILTYEGRIRVEDVVIQSFSPNFGPENKKGFGFSLALKKVNIGSAEYMPAGEAPLMSQQDKGKAASNMKTAATKADGLKTTVSTSISSSAYTSYVNSYSSKPAGSAGPSTRKTPGNSGLTM